MQVYPRGLMVGARLDGAHVFAGAEVLPLGERRQFGGAIAHKGIKAQVRVVQSRRNVAAGAALIVALGLLAGLMPAVTAMRLKITDALRRT